MWHTSERREVRKVLVGKPKGKRQLRRPRHRWKDGIRTDLGETGWDSVEGIQLDQDRVWWWALAKMEKNLQVLTPHG
jgi:hypothetical protein